MAIQIVFVWLCAYLLGALPSGLLWAWLLKGVDVRKHGSGRTGGTNVWRTAGFVAALFTVLSDAFKGAVAIWLGRAFGIDLWALALAGALTVVGHNYSCFVRFRGGAGTVTSMGAAATLWLPALPVLVGLGLLVSLLVGHASLASILIAIALPVLFALAGMPVVAVAFGVPVMLFTLWALRPNLVRLWHGQERFLPIYFDKPPLICLSQHPGRRQS